MKQEKRVFLFLYEHLKLGGIEKALVDQINTYYSMGIRIIWLRYGNKEDIYEPWKDTINEKVEVIDVNIDLKDWTKSFKLQFDENEHIFAVAYEPCDFARLEVLTKKYNNVFEIFYQVPHFKGRVNYLEEYYNSSWTRNSKAIKLSEIYKRWYKNGNLLFFSYKHVEEMHKRYNLDCLERRDLVFKTPILPEKLDYELLKKRSRREEFRIITCGRFEFPHKGYMLGLIDAYCKLKPNYPQLKLDIIGYGIDEQKIVDYISQVTPDLAKDVSLIGPVSPKELKAYFDRSHVNVSVAGSLLDGAKTGIVSLPARHYTYKCEVYGYLSNEIGEYLDDREGEDVCQYIEALINMSDDDYEYLCKQSYDFAVKQIEYDPEWLFAQKNQVVNYCNDEEIKYISKIETHHKIKLAINKRIDLYAKKLGIYRILKTMKVVILRNTDE